MLELVNTSLPNGLLPGTHGFSTVAMTRGMPDSVRIALESLSSYRHRHGGNDPRYATENPVAWSHVVQRDGSHVVSCVRASEFDYTGRTNRLARHWYFPRGEFPSGANPADVVAANVSSLSASWKGNARWLEPESDSPVATVPQRRNRRAATWSALYGRERGPALAAGFASLLRSEIQGGQRSIAFRTSQSWDHDGTKLLLLFADLIALLPAELRDKATFSTYPAALPSHVVCHLRGMQPDAPDFSAYTSGRPWFDCATGTVGNETRLPKDQALEKVAMLGYEERIVPVAQPPKSVVSESTPATSADEGAAAEEPVVAPAPSPIAEIHPQERRNAARITSANDLLPPPRPDNTMLYAIIGGLVVAVAILVAALVVLKSGPKPPPPPFPLPAQTNENESVHQVETESQRSQPDSTPENDATNHPPAEAVRPAAVSTVEETSADTKPETAPPRQKWAFEDAVKLLASEPRAEESFGEGWWFYYDKSGDFKKCDATPEKSGGFVLQYKNRPKDFHHCALLYQCKEKALFFEFPKQDVKIFAETNDTVNLMEMCFGSCNPVFETWMKLNGGGTNANYTANYTVICLNDGKSILEFSCDNHELKLETVVEKLCKTEIEELKHNLSIAKTKKVNADQKAKDTADLLSQSSNIWKRVEKIMNDKTLKKTDRDKKLKEIWENNSSFTNKLTEVFPESHSWWPNEKSPSHLKAIVERLDSQSKTIQGSVAKADENYRIANDALEKYKNDKRHRDKARNMRYRVKPVSAVLEKSR